MSFVQRFLLGNRTEDNLEVGLFLKNDGTVWLRNPDGSETQVTGGGGSGLLLTASVELTAAEVLALDSVPIQVVAAPGSGKAISVVKAVGVYTFVSRKFSKDPNGSSTLLKIRWGASSATDETWTDLYSAISGAISAASDNVNATFLTDVPSADYDNQPLSLASAHSLRFGPIATSTKNAGGTGYAPGDTGTVDGAGSADATYVIDTVDGGGAVLTYHLDASGTAYEDTIGVTTTASSGGGSGFTIDITDVAKGNGTLEITIYYVLLDLS